MYHTREVKTKTGSRSLKVVRYTNGKRVIIRLIGTGHSPEEIMALREIARSFIEDLSKQGSLFTMEQTPDRVVTLSQCEYRGFYYSYLYEVLYAIQAQIGYTKGVDSMLNDLVIMRIAEPTSKLRSIELIETYFGIGHRRQRYYESALEWLSLKEGVETQTLHFARQQYGFDFSRGEYEII